MMKKAIVSFVILAMSMFGGCRPAEAMDACYKIEFEDNVFSFVAPEDGTYTFKGGKVGVSPNGYLITVVLDAGEVWVVPPVGDVPGAAISHVVICPDPEDPEDPDCIHKDPATIRYGEVDKFKMHGRLLPVTPLDFSNGVTIELGSAGGSLLEIYAAPEYISIDSRSVLVQTEDTRIRFSSRRGGVWVVTLAYSGEIAESQTSAITFDLGVGTQLFRVTGNWKARKTGWFLNNKSYICEE